MRAAHSRETTRTHFASHAAMADAAAGEAMCAGGAGSCR